MSSPLPYLPFPIIIQIVYIKQAQKKATVTST